MEQKRLPKKNLEKEKGAHKYNAAKNQAQVKFKFACNHDKQCSICSYEVPRNGLRIIILNLQR